MSTYYDPTINLDEQAQKEENKLVNLALSKLPQPHITGLKLRGDVQLGNLVLNQIDPTTGVVWVLTGLEGWWTLPDPEFPDLPRGWGDGSYEADGRYAARVMTLEGSFLTQDPNQVAEARAKLVAAIDLVYRGTDLIVREPVSLTVTQINSLPIEDATSANDTLFVPNHGLSANSAVVYRSSGRAIFGLVSGTTYFIKTVVDANRLILSAVSGGAAEDITGSGLPSLTSHTLSIVDNTITIPDHGLVIGDVITYRAVGTAISGLVSGRQYHVTGTPTINTFRLSATAGGTGISLTQTILPANSRHQFDVIKPKVSSVRVSGKPQIDTVNARGRTNFSIGLKAADPIKYEYVDSALTGNYRTVALTRDTNITVRNSGNTKVPVIFGVTGQINVADRADTKITRTYQDPEIDLVKTIAGIYNDTSATKLDINTYNRTVALVSTINNEAINGRKYVNSFVEWIYLEPGDNILRFSTPDTEAQCVMFYKSGWLA